MSALQQQHDISIIDAPEWRQLLSTLWWHHMWLLRYYTSEKQTKTCLPTHLANSDAGVSTKAVAVGVVTCRRDLWAKTVRSTTTAAATGLVALENQLVYGRKRPVTKHVTMIVPRRWVRGDHDWFASPSKTLRSAHGRFEEFDYFLNNETSGDFRTCLLISCSFCDWAQLFQGIFTNQVRSWNTKKTGG